MSSQNESFNTISNVRIIKYNKFKNDTSIHKILNNSNQKFLTPNVQINLNVSKV